MGIPQGSNESDLAPEDSEVKPHLQKGFGGCLREEVDMTLIDPDSSRCIQSPCQHDHRLGQEGWKLTVHWGCKQIDFWEALLFTSTWNSRNHRVHTIEDYWLHPPRCCPVQVDTSSSGLALTLLQCRRAILAARGAQASGTTLSCLYSALQPCCPCQHMDGC